MADVRGGRVEAGPGWLGDFQQPGIIGGFAVGPQASVKHQRVGSNLLQAAFG